MDKRVKFDFEIHFTNGGGIKGEDFRLDILGNDISDKALAEYIVSDMRLLMVGETKILNKIIFEEVHKRKPVNESNRSELLIDLSHTIENKMASSSGTYINVPFHRYKEGKDLSEMVLDHFTGLDGIVINVPFFETLAITEDHLKHCEIRNRAVLIHTKWARNWNTQTYFNDHPYLTEGAATYLKNCNIKLVGIDSHSIDRASGKTRPAHDILLAEEILIVESLCNLDLLPEDGFTFSAIPPKIHGVGTFPVRAMAKLKQTS